MFRRKNVIFLLRLPELNEPVCNMPNSGLNVEECDQQTMIVVTQPGS